jgi:hypothetical protein
MSLIASIPACALMLCIAALAFRRAFMSSSRNWIRYVAVVALSLHGMAMTLFIVDDPTGRVAAVSALIVLGTWLAVRALCARRHAEYDGSADERGLAPLL